MSHRSSKRRASGPELVQIPFQWDDALEIPPHVTKLLEAADARLQLYWDQWHTKPIEQYLACDFRDVWQSLRFVAENNLAPGKLFCEWGCGFGIVTALASILGFESIGIEAEPFLVAEARKFLKGQNIDAEIWNGNFLPDGSERLARSQSNHASLFHNVPDAYREHEIDADDFALIFAYPWPGEDQFFQDVFLHHAADNALLLMFLGPYQIELYRKHSAA